MLKKVVIIGSGPAGYTAAIYAARAMLEPVLITGNDMGGQLMTTSDVENFPGYPKGVSGMIMMEDMYKQAEHFGTSFIYDNVQTIDIDKKPFKIYLDNNSEIFAHSIIIATGAKALWLNLPGETKLRGRGISTCAVCDGFLFSGKKLLVIGGGDSAMEEAIFLTRYAEKVTIVHRRNEFKASKIMLERAQQNDKIDWKTNTIVKGWVSNAEGSLCEVILVTNERDERIKCDGAFIAIGHKPSTDFLEKKVDMDVNGYILLKENMMTSVEGIFACGDVCDTRYKQAITASSDGCKAAMDCEKWLMEKNI